MIGTLARAGPVLLACGSAAFAADLPIADPVNDVRICAFTDETDTHYYVPGTDTCLGLHGYARAEMHYVGGDPSAFLDGTNSEFNNWTTRARGTLEVDTRTQTDFGEVQTYLTFEFTIGPENFDTNYDFTDLDLDAAYVAVTNPYGTFTAGITGSFFDFFSSDAYGTRIDLDDATEDPTLFAYSLGINDGWTETLSIEDPDSVGRRLDGADDYEGLEAPDVIGSIKYDVGNVSAQVMAMVRQIHDVSDDGIGWAVGAGFQVEEIASVLGYSTQVTYGDGAIGYVTTDPGGIGDIEGPSGSETNQAWGVRSGLTAQLTPSVLSWLDGSFTHVENHSGSDEYDFWAIVSGAAWTPNDSLTMGPEVGFNRIDGDDAGEDGSVWGVMWRVERDF